jgi:small subunit ribosomal protein S15
MAVTKQRTEEVVKKFRRSELDTGSCEVQVALLTERITTLSGHFVAHKKDFHGQRGLVKMVVQRRKLLDYLKRTDQNKYLKLIKDLDIRK